MMSATHAGRAIWGILVFFAAASFPASAVEIWVAPNGNDAAAGTAAQPFASTARAQRQARELRRLEQVATNELVKIILRGGTYRLTSALLFRPEDSGTEASPTILAAATNEQPLLSGGVLVSGWKKLVEKIPGLPAASRGEVWVSEPPTFGGRLLETRQLWVNGRKAVRASEPNGDNLNRLLALDPARQEAWIPASLVAGLREPGRVELVLQQQWEIAVLRLNSVRIEGDRAALTFQAPEGKLEFEHPWPQPVMSTNGNAPFFLANALEFLDEPGEWFQQMPGGRIFYWPRPGEDLAKAEVTAPALETLVEMVGTADRPVSNVRFQGIAFAHTTWLRPSAAGHVPLQAGMFLLDAYRLSPKGTRDRPKLDNQAWIGRPPGAVMSRGAHHLGFSRCRFEHLASAGVDFVNGTQDDAIEGCVFRDLGGNGIQLGTFSEPGFETHLPFRPADEREVCAREKIANNLITDCANEDWGCVGIGVGFARDITVEHNEVFDLPYTGISVGWGWTKATNAMSTNRIIANHVHHVGRRLIDLAGIYLLSAQPGTVVSENSVHDIQVSSYVHDPEHWFYLYLDEGASFITVRDNWCPAEKFLKNANGPGNRWENNGPAVAQKIRDAAGLEPAFRDLRLDGTR